MLFLNDITTPRTTNSNIPETFSTANFDNLSEKKTKITILVIPEMPLMLIQNII